MNPELNDLIELDKAGFLPLPGESSDAFAGRFQKSQTGFETFRQELESGGRAVLFDEIEVTPEQRIPDEVIGEAAEKTEELYAFRNFRVPGFFLTREVGLLWGGCMIGDPDCGLAVLLLRGAFRCRKRWLVYSRDELLAHELCHAMRQSLTEPSLEEFFAYQTSPSRLRRITGNCFIHDYDAFLFLLPAVLLFAASLVQSFFLGSLPLLPFWLPVILCPGYLILRSFRSIRIVRKAERALHLAGVGKPMPLLFRSTLAELRTLGACRTAEEVSASIEKFAAQELRWQIIKQRFLSGENCHETC